jgi:hypothetical protein
LFNGERPNDLPNQDDAAALGEAAAAAVERAALEVFEAAPSSPADWASGISGQ